MPDFETTVDVDVTEFLDACSTWERAEALDYLLEDSPGNQKLEAQLKKSLSEHFPHLSVINGPALGSENMSYDQEEFMTSLNKLNQAYYQLSNEDIDIINKMAKRF